MTAIARVVGSAREASVHRRLALATAEVAGDDIDLDLLDGLDRLPLYNEDLDAHGSTPVEVSALRARLIAVDAVLLFAPANNGTLSAVLKNAMDWASRPYGRSSLQDKPVAIVSAAHRTETVEQHAQLVVTIAGGVPVGPSALFRLKGLDVDDPSVGHALRQALDALDEAVLGQEDRRRAS